MRDSKQINGNIKFADKHIVAIFEIQWKKWAINKMT